MDYPVVVCFSGLPSFIQEYLTLNFKALGLYDNESMSSQERLQAYADHLRLRHVQLAGFIAVAAEDSQAAVPEVLQATYDREAKAAATQIIKIIGLLETIEGRNKPTSRLINSCSNAVYHSRLNFKRKTQSELFIL